MVVTEHVRAFWTRLAPLLANRMAAASWEWRRYRARTGIRHTQWCNDPEKRLLMYIASWPRVKARWASSTRFRAIGAAAAAARLHPLSKRNSFVQMCSRRAMLFFKQSSALVAKNKRLPVAHRRDGCDPINALSDPEKRLRMYIASICTLGVNSFPRIALGIRFRIASMARFS